ncbi:MAG TPA: hypothetical protein VFR81_30680 [Longimicrobium sp.]|nr:hypothetical protein [Longimicrobium sp.]
MKRYVAIYGGTDLDADSQAFVALLARTILAETDLTLVIGGFDRRKDQRGTVSVDRAAERGALELLAASGQPVEERVETWLPGGEDRDDAERFSIGRRVVLHGQSDQARRFRLVAGVGAIVTVHGEGNTRTVLDLAFAIDRPVLPLAFAGGDSAEVWNGRGGDPPNEDNLDRIRANFGLTPELEARIRGASRGDLTVDFAREIVAAVGRAIRRKCLVLMRYEAESDRFYDETVAPAITAAGYDAVRIDHVARGGDILALFHAGLADADAVVADVTGARTNPNVMYELGHAHARGIHPLLFARTRPEGIRDELPIYLSEQSVKPAGTPEEVRALVEAIRGYLAYAARAGSSPPA